MISIASSPLPLKGSILLGRVCKHWDQKAERLDPSVSPPVASTKLSALFAPSDAFGGHP
jgi:hypothetical protein